MKYVARELSTTLKRAVRAFPAVVLSGPRRAGKTTLLRHLFPRADYRLLEDPAVLAAVRSDPRGFLDELALPVILDEIQNATELLGFIRARIDAAGGSMSSAGWDGIHGGVRAAEPASICVNRSGDSLSPSR